MIYPRTPQEQQLIIDLVTNIRKNAMTTPDAKKYVENSIKPFTWCGRMLNGNTIFDGRSNEKIFYGFLNVWSNGINSTTPLPLSIQLKDKLITYVGINNNECPMIFDLCGATGIIFGWLIGYELTFNN